MTNYNVICRDSGCDTMCPDSCEVPRTAILRGLIWWNGVTDLGDVKGTEYEVKNDKDRVAKGPMTFEGKSDSFDSLIWSFEVDLGSTSNSDVLPQEDWPNWEISVKQKIEDEDKNKLQTDRFDLTTLDQPLPNYALNLVGFAGVATKTTDNHCEASGTTGGQGGQSVIVGVGDEAKLYDYASRTGKYIILINGMLGPPPNESNDKPFYRIASDKSILGINRNSGFSGAGLRIEGDRFSSGASKDKNIIIRNINFENAPDGFDAIGVQDEAECIWIDHCSFSNPARGTDGALDIKTGSDYITISWNTFSDYEVTPDDGDEDNDFRAMLIGHNDDEVGDKDDFHVTLHHNRFVNCDQRLPRVRHSKLVHVFNNYYENVESYAIGSAEEAYVFVEGNYFVNVEDPIDTCVGNGKRGYAAELDNVYINSPTAGSCHANKDVTELVEEPTYTYFVNTSVPEITLLGAGTGKIICGSDGLCV